MGGEVNIRVYGKREEKNRLLVVFPHGLHEEA
jgi:hypothetical protein